MENQLTIRWTEAVDRPLIDGKFTRHRSVIGGVRHTKMAYTNTRPQMTPCEATNRRLSRILLLAPIGVILFCFLTIYVGVPLMFAWPDFKHQLTLDGKKEFERSAGYVLPANAELFFCEDTRGGWHGDGQLDVHIRSDEATIETWLTRPFKDCEWNEGFLHPKFQSPDRLRDAVGLIAYRRYWARFGDSGNWRFIIVQPQTGDVWYTEYNS